MTILPKHPIAGIWYKTYSEDAESMIGVLIHSVEKAMLFDALFESGLFEKNFAQAKEEFLLTAPGYPVLLPSNALEKVIAHFDINADNDGKLYRNELEAHYALNPQTCSQNQDNQLPLAQRQKA